MLCARLSRVVLAGYWAVRAVFCFVLFFPGRVGTELGRRPEPRRVVAGLSASPRGLSRRLLAHLPGSRLSSGQSQSISSC